jgi:hypothetical protein
MSVSAPFDMAKRHICQAMQDGGNSHSLPRSGGKLAGGGCTAARQGLRIGAQFVGLSRIGHVSWHLARRGRAIGSPRMHGAASLRSGVQGVAMRPARAALSDVHSGRGCRGLTLFEHAQRLIPRQFTLGRIRPRFVPMRADLPAATGWRGATWTRYVHGSAPSCHCGTAQSHPHRAEGQDALY